MKDVSPRETLAEKAAQCLLCLEDPEASAGTKLRWRAWLSESPSNWAAFEACKAFWNVPPSPDLAWPTPAEIARDAYAGDAPIPVAGSKAGRPGLAAERARSRVPAARLAFAALAVAATVGVVQLLPGAPKPNVERFTTARAEQKQLRFGDGSEILLGPQSQLEVRYAPGERRFDLASGEAIFTVVHDPTRPVRVFAGAGWVEDIGTAFSVRTGADGVTVTVLRGEVAVNSGREDATNGAKLEPNQEITYGVSLGPVRKVDSALVTGWSRGQLAYIDRPLGEVLADLRRYSLKDVVVRDEGVEALRYTGTISVDHVDQWAAGLARAYPVRVESSAGRLVLASTTGGH